MPHLIWLYLGWVTDGSIEEIRLAMGAVAPTAVRLHHVEQLLAGKPVEIALESKIFAEVEQDIAPISDFRATRSYRVQVARNLLEEQVRSVLGFPELSNKD